MPAAVGKHHKREVGRAAADETPLNLRTHKVSLDPAIEDYVRDRAGRRLGKHAVHIQRVTVRFDDVNGPKRGVDIVCKIEVAMEGAPSIVITQKAAHPRDAFDFAIDAAETAVVRDLQRRGRGAPHRRRQGAAKARIKTTSPTARAQPARTRA